MSTHPIHIQPKQNPCQLCHARDICMTAELDLNEYRNFEDVVVHRAPINRGEKLFSAGDEIRSIYILHSGSAKAHLESPDGDYQITGFYLPGDVLGLHGQVARHHTETVEALETSSFCELKFRQIEDLCDAIPALKKPMIQSIFSEMDHEQEMMLVLGKLSAERRMAYFLVDIARRLEARGLSSVRLNLTMTRHDIANYLGLAVETVSRIFTRMQKLKLLRVERRTITILDPAALHSLLNSSETPPLIEHRV